MSRATSLPVLALLLVAAGCGGKLGPDEAARAYAREYAPKGAAVTCRDGTNGWDYDCVVRVPRLHDVFPVSVDVDGHRIVGRSGT